MGQILHGSATTTEAVRRAIQQSQESLRGLAKRYGVNPKTVAKWKARTSVSDLPTGPKQPRSTVLSVEEEDGNLGEAGLDGAEASAVARDDHVITADADRVGDLDVLDRGDEA